MLSDNDGMEDGHPAAGAPAVGIVPEAAELVFAPLLDPHRDDDGQYSTNSRRKRVQQEPQFPVIELDTLEPTQCYADGADVPNVCASPHLCSGHGGTRCKIWRIRGPVRGYNDAGWRLSTVTIVRARASLPPHEVYVRSVRWLVPGTYVDMPDVYNSVRFVAKARTRANQSWEVTSPTSSYRGFADGQDLQDGDVAIILREAATLMRLAVNKVAEGHVVLIRRESSINDPVNVTKLRALLRRRADVAIEDYRRKGAIAMQQRWAQLLIGFGAGMVARVRRILELEPSGEDDGTNKRASRVRVRRRFSQLRLLPTAAQLREVRRVAFDDASRVRHFFSHAAATG